MLNSEQLSHYITGAGPDNIQQVGIDLNLIKVEHISTVDVKQTGVMQDGIAFDVFAGAGFIPREGKTGLANRYEVSLSDNKWFLTPGVYDITFAQGCEIPENIVMFIRQRSSLLRNGSLLHSSVFDPGFKTSNIGTILHVREPIVIENYARIAQIYGYVCTPVSPDKLYDGQWQGDKQRTNI